MTAARRPHRWLLLASLGMAAAWWVFGTADAPVDPRTHTRSTVHDFVLYYGPNAAYLGERLRAGELPLWNPQQGLGGPFLATLQPGVLYPPNWLHALLPTPIAFAVITAVHMALASFGAGALALALGANALGAILAGLLFATCSNVVASILVPPILHSAAWLPLVLLCVDRCLARPSAARSAALALALAAQISCGWPFMTAMTVLACAGYGLPVLVARLRRTRRLPGDALGALLGGGLGGLALGAPLLLPAVELLERSTRALGTLGASQAIWVDGPHDPALFWRNLLALGTGPGIPGLPALALAITAVVLPGPRRLRAAALLAVGALLLAASFPYHLPVYDALRSLPVLGDFRFPHRYRMVTSLALSVLAGVGVAQLGSWVRTRGRAGLAPVVVAACAALALGSRFSVAGLVDVPMPLRTAPPRSLDAQLGTHVALPRPLDRSRVFWDEREGRLGVAGARDASFDLEPLTLARTAQAFTFLELGITLGVDHRLRRPPSERRAGDDGDARVDMAPFYGRAALPRDPHAPRRAALLDVLAIDLIATRRPPAWLAGGFERLTAPEAALQVFHNPRALPRVYRVARAEPTPVDLRQALERLAAPDFDPRVSALLPAPVAAALADAPADPDAGAVLLDYAPESLHIRTWGTRPGVVVIADSAYPGWTARLDGQPVPLQRANALFRAVLVPAGENRLELRYRPGSFGAGVAIAAAQLVLGGSLLLFERWRRLPSGNAG